MTLIEFFDDVPIDNMVSCLSIKPEKVVFVGDKKPMKKQEDVYLRLTEKYNIQVVFEYVSFFSKLPFNVEEDKRIDVALAICAVNYWLADGSFDYDLSDGSILFRLTSSYKESTLGEALFEYMVVVSAATVDNYNDKFFMMSKGMMTYQQFIEAHDD